MPPLSRVRIPSLSSLRAFEAVARHLSFTRAAEELHITQGAVSYQIRQLEDELGVQLFRRERRRIALTEKARRLTPVLQRAFSDISEALAALSPRADGPQLTVALSTYFAAHWLSGRLGTFWQRNPGVKLRLQHPETPINFGVDDVDMAISWHEASWSDPSLTVERLFLSQNSPVCSPALFAGKRSSGKPKEILKYTMLADGITQPAWTAWFKLAGISHPKSMRELRINDPNVYIQAAIDGQGMAMGDGLLADEIALSRLIMPFKVSLTTYGYFLTYPPDALQRPTVKAFRDWIVAEARAHKANTKA